MPSTLTALRVAATVSIFIGLIISTPGAGGSAISSRKYFSPGAISSGIIHSIWSPIRMVSRLSLLAGLSCARPAVNAARRAIVRISFLI